MNRKIKDALTLGIAAAFVLMFALWSICKSDDAVSESERRPLKQFPTLNVEEVLSGRFQSNFESYTLDQFPLRDELRTLKALSVHDLFGEKDNNGIYVADGYAAKLDDTIHEDSLDHAVDRFRYVYETYLKNTGANVYLSVIPDKNYFLAAENGYPAMDYEKFFALMRQKVDFADYIDLTGTLSLSSYYRTDLHWRQEMLAPTAKALADAMGVSLTVDFTEVTLDTPFYGVYRGQSALPMEPDRLAYLTNDIIGSCRVYDYENSEYLPVYTLEKADGKKIFVWHLNGMENMPCGAAYNNDEKRLWPGEPGDCLDHKRYADTLKKIGFEGDVCTMEVFRPDYYKLSNEENIKKAAEVTKAHVAKYWAD